MITSQGNPPLHCASEKQASLEVISALMQTHPAAALTSNESGFKPFQLCVKGAKGRSLDERLEITRLFILPGADMAVIKSELKDIYGKKFDTFDHEKKEVLQPADMVQLALSINVSLTRLQLADDQPIARDEFADACTRHVFDTAPNQLAAQKHALAGLSSLRSFGEAYRVVQATGTMGLRQAKR